MTEPSTRNKSKDRRETPPLAPPTRSWIGQCLATWDRFWFTPTQPYTLAMLRIMAGAMLFYTHVVWTLDLSAFLGKDAWVTADVSQALHRDSYVWSYLWYIESSWLLWAVHLAALVVFAMLTVGLFTRYVSVLACIITLSYCHRLNGALYGLDQVNAMFAMYLMIGDAGAVYSLDRWRKGRGGESEVTPRISTNIAIRLIQLHMCVVYLFGGIGKMRGEMWWDGSAFWYALSSYEYQSFDLTWLGRWPVLVAIVTHVTVFWETFYWALVWSRITRPIALACAFVVHGGIAVGLGMITFGTAMIIGNLSFIEPETTRKLVEKITSRVRRSRAGEG